jgi:hypothetical protein
MDIENCVCEEEVDEIQVNKTCALLLFNHKY